MGGTEDASLGTDELGADTALADAGTNALEVPMLTDFHEPVPILMYHAIQPAPVGAPMPGLYVPQAEFEEQMRWLADRGYHAVTLRQVFAAWDDGEPIATKPVVISFDDGLQSQYVGARPVLQRLRWPGVLNLAISHLEQGEMTAEEIRELLGEGWELDSHSLTHRNVDQLDAPELRRELAGSRRWLENHFDTPVDFFCYPAGAYDDAAIEAVRAAGYEGATTTNEGLASPDEPFTMSRIRVEPGDGATGLERKLDAARSSSQPLS